MAREVTEFAISGVSQVVYDAHTHNYRKITQIGGDADDKWASPTLVDVVDDATTEAHEQVDLEAVGVTVSTQPTETPNA